jgi:hypothetical protein
MYELNVDGEGVQFAPDRMFNAGYSGRDGEAVQAHIDELVEEGVPGPEEIPAVYELASYTLLVDPGEISVVGQDTSGEAEFALVVTGDDTYVAVASDHTDRDLESESIPKSKQIAPNVVSRRAWRLSDVDGHWDDIELRAWNTHDGERNLYQDAALAELLPPEEVLDTVRDRFCGQLHGSAVLSGTVPTISDELVPGSRFEVELFDPVRDRALSVGYDVNVV